MSTQTIYYEVQILDWIKRADLDGDGMLMKTYIKVGQGSERCRDND